MCGGGASAVRVYALQWWCGCQGGGGYLDRCLHCHEGDGFFLSGEVFGVTFRHRVGGFVALEARVAGDVLEDDVDIIPRQSPDFRPDVVERGCFRMWVPL